MIILFLFLQTKDVYHQSSSVEIPGRGKQHTEGRTELKESLFSEKKKISLFHKYIY